MGKSARYDSSRVKLRTGEYQKSDGRYEFRYTVFGKKYSVYAKSLDELRDKEVEIYSVKTANQTRFDSRTTTLNDVFELWKELKRGLRPNTYQNYCYMYQQYVQESLGRQYVASIKKSDVKRFFNHLADERRLKEGTIEAVQTILHQCFKLPWMMSGLKRILLTMP